MAQDPSLSFIKRHHFKDTLALLIVFLSFNHFASLLLLVSFSIVSRSRNFLAECFIRLFLPKSHYNGLVDDDEFQIKPVPQAPVAAGPFHSVISNTTTPKGKKKRDGAGSKQSGPIPPTVTPTGSGTGSGGVSVLSVTTTGTGLSNSITDWRRKRSGRQMALIFLQEVVVACLLRYYGDKYFTEPIENLAMSIVASSLVNDPKDALSAATTCSIIYALSTQWIQKLMFFLDFKNSMFEFPSRPSTSRWALLIDRYPRMTGTLLTVFEILSFSSKYIRYAAYLASFHVVVSQLEQNLRFQSHEHRNNDHPATADIASLSSSATHSQVNNITNGTNSHTAGNTTTCSSGPASYPMPSNPSMSTPAKDSHALQGAHMTQSASMSSALPVSQPASMHSTRPQEQIPVYSPLVKESGVKSISITSPSASNSQTWIPNITTAFSTESNLDHHNDLSNQVYKLELNLNCKDQCPNLSTVSTVNLQNFVRQLFRWKTHHVLPPIWAIFTATQTLISEKNNISASNDNVTPLTTTVVISDDKINVGTDTESTSSQAFKSDLSPTNSNAGKSVFTNKSTSDSITLIAPAMDDYHKLNLISTESKNDYRVCITFIGSNSITFKIDNLFEGELIILVNGVIWSQVGSAIVPDVPGQEYTVVSGLVPLCSYDIQFVNRLNELEDYLIADLMIRTIGKNGDQEALDLSFPSYYHRKFLSPILTLKHSILTTNANLAEERVKLKKSRKEVTKKVNAMKQDIEGYKSKLEFNVIQDEKSASKVENLKMALKQGESQTMQLEDTLKSLSQKEAELEEIYLVEKDRYFQSTLEFSKTEDQWKSKVQSSQSQANKLKQDLQQLEAKKSKVLSKHSKLQKEVNQINNDFDKFATSFLEKRNKQRVERNQQRSQEATDFELKIKGLEQDISRLEGEASHIHQILQHNSRYN